MTPETQARIDTIARYAAPDGDGRTVQYTPDPEDQPVDSLAFWHALLLADGVMAALVLIGFIVGISLYVALS